MTLRIVVELSDADLEHYRQVLRDAWQRGSKRAEAELLQIGRRLLEKMREARLSATVRERLEDLGALIAMLEDPEWALEGEDRERILAAASYFAEPLDLIPDTLPGFGYLDDALMAELIVRELKPELDAYRDFCGFRAHQEELGGAGAHVDRGDWLAAKRRQLFARIERRRANPRRHGSRESPTPPILQYRP